VKKFFAVLVLAALIIPVLSAQSTFTWSAWGRAVFAPISFDDVDSSVSAATATFSTPGNAPRLGFTLAGTSESEKIGFIAQFQMNEWTTAADLVGENAKVWIKPFPFLKLTVGKFNEDDLRSTIGNTEFNTWLVPSGGKDEDGIFDRFQATLGAHIALTPIEGLYIEAAVGSSPGNIRANRNLYNISALDIYKAIQVGVGYRIPDIGFVRAQFIGNNRSQLKQDDDLVMTSKVLMEGLTMNRDADIIEAAFQFNRVTGLNIDVGFKYPLPYVTDTGFTIYPALLPSPPLLNIAGTEVKVQLPVVAALGATYKWNNLSALGRVDFASGGSFEQEGVYKITTGMSLGFWLVPAYQITSTIKAGFDIGFEMHIIDNQEKPIGVTIDLIGSDYSDIGLGPWVELNVGGGTVKTGVMIMLPNTPRYIYNSGHTIAWKDSFSGKPVVTIPISLTYNF
jgi:hypothetical protein